MDSSIAPFVVMIWTIAGFMMTAKMKRDTDGKVQVTWDLKDGKTIIAAGPMAWIASLVSKKEEAV